MQDNVIIAYIDSSLLDFWNSIESMTMYPSPCHMRPLVTRKYFSLSMSF